MTDRDIMQQALDALVTCKAALAEELAAWDIDPPLYHVQESHDLCGPAIADLRERLAHCDRCGKLLGGEGHIHTCTPKQPEQEPVAWISAVTGDVTTQDMSHTVSWVPLTTPPAAQPAPVPEGWKMVPMEPTREMWTAVNKLDDQMAAGSYDGKGCSIEQAWNCLLDAAPTPPAAAQRTWVGLTNKDIIEMWPQTSTVGWDDIRLIEAKLKEKNT